MQIICLFIFESNMQQKNITTVYRQFPQSKTVQHHIHASIAIVGQEWKRAGSEKTNPDVRRLTVRALNARGASTAAAFPLWPKVLLATDLSKQASEQPVEMQWWLGEHAADDSGEGKYSQCFYPHLMFSPAPRRSGRINKGKGPLPPDADMDVDPPAQSRGRKRSAATASQGLGAEGTGDIDPTPRKRTTPVNRPKPVVLVDSPPKPRPAQRRPVAGDLEATVAHVPAAPSEPADSVEPGAPASEMLWVARGKVSIV